MECLGVLCICINTQILCLVPKERRELESYHETHALDFPVFSFSVRGLERKGVSGPPRTPPQTYC